MAPAGAAYALLIASQMLSSWAHQNQNAYTHTVQPVATLIFAAALVIYSRTNEHRGAEELSAASSTVVL